MMSITLDEISKYIEPWEVAKIKVSMEAYFKRPNRVGFYEVAFDTPFYRLAFLVEIPEKGHPFVYEALLAKKSTWGKARFDREVELYNKYPEKMPSRIKARQQHDANLRKEKEN